MNRFLLLGMLLAVVLPFTLAAQTNNQQDTTCNFLKDIKFKNGTATITVSAYYRDYHRSGDEPLLSILAKKKKLQYNDYDTPDAGCSAIGFIPIGCNKYTDGPISHKAHFNPEKIKRGETLYLTCVAFEDKSVRAKQGSYFFVITGVHSKNSAK